MARAFAYSDLGGTNRVGWVACSGNDVAGDTYADSPKSVCNPRIFAFPMFVLAKRVRVCRHDRRRRRELPTHLSRNENRNSTASIGNILVSSFLKRAFVTLFSSSSVMFRRLLSPSSMNESEAGFKSST
jgi:hypothetical protein